LALVLASSFSLGGEFLAFRFGFCPGFQGGLARSAWSPSSPPTLALALALVFALALALAFALALALVLVFALALAFASCRSIIHFSTEKRVLLLQDL
jgi:hypothetical protein